MALSRTNLLGAVSNAGGDFGTGAYTTGSFTPASSSLLVVGVGAIENGNTDTMSANLSIADSQTLTWSQRANAVVTGGYGTVTRIYTAPVATGTSMTLTLDCGTVSIGCYMVSAICYTGYNTSTPTGATASGSQNGGFSGPPDPVTITLSGAPASTSEVFAAVAADRSNAGVTPGTGWTEIHDVAMTDGNWGGMETEIRTGSTSTSVDWVDIRSAGGALFNFTAVAVEIAESGGAAAPPPKVQLVAPGLAAIQGSYW